MECCHDKACVEEHPQTIRAWWFQLSNFKVHRRLPGLASHNDVDVRLFKAPLGAICAGYVDAERQSRGIYCHPSRSTKTAPESVP